MAFVHVTDTDAIPAGEVKVFDLSEDLSLCIANVEGRFFAIDNVCTHDGGTLGEGMLWGSDVECPRHGARFDVETGRVRALPAVLPVKTYPTRISGTSVEVDVE